MVGIRIPPPTPARKRKAVSIQKFRANMKRARPSEKRKAPARKL